MSYQTDRSRVEGLGSAKEGTHHFTVQRLTAIALVPLTLFFIFTLAAAMGSSLEEVRAVYSSPFNAIVAILFLGTAFYHLKLGLQVVIEDYVHGKLTRTSLLIANILFCWAFGLSGVFAVAKIAFTA
jgi:succinate dehydrogenase membrane anchor subunit